MKRISILMLILFTCLVSAAWPQAQPQCKHKIITFDVPGAGRASGQGTFAFGIVQGDWIEGNYIDAKGVYHGFLRAPDGTITKFDVPGMGKGAGQGAVAVWGMNPALQIAGHYLDPNNVNHGFLRTRHGKITTFDVPGAGTDPGQGTNGEAINPAGVILGDYWDSNNGLHGYLRAPDGTFTTFDAPDAGSGAGQGTYTAIFSGINPEGAAVGEYLDNNNLFHGYLRDPDGNITEFDDPYAGTGGGTGSLGISPAGEIWGWYFDTNSAFHGFLRATDGTFTEVDAPGAGTGAGQGTTACVFMACLGGSNPAGTVTSGYVDANNVVHGFLRTPRGKFTTFDAPGAGTGTYQGTEPTSINPEGAITGFYVDANGVYHGFLRSGHDKQ
jgi:hypothetical protein